MALQISNETPIEAVSIGDNEGGLPPWVGDMFMTTTLTSANGTTPVILLTPVAGYYVTRLFVEIDPICTQTTGGMVTVDFTDSSFGSIGQFRVYIPSTVANPTVPTAGPSMQSSPGFIWRNLSPASTLSVSVSNTLTAGSIRVEVNGGRTPIVA